MECQAVDHVDPMGCLLIALDFQIDTLGSVPGLGVTPDIFLMLTLYEDGLIMNRFEPLFWITTGALVAILNISLIDLWL